MITTYDTAHRRSERLPLRWAVFVWLGLGALCWIPIIWLIVEVIS